MKGAILKTLTVFTVAFCVICPVYADEDEGGYFDNGIVAFNGYDVSDFRELSQDESEIIIWTHLMGVIDNSYGVAGLMGNLYAESRLRSVNLQQTYEKKFGMNDYEYTDAVDDGNYGKNAFSEDWAGYGIAQWTYPSRKKGLYEALVEKGFSISDLSGQLDYLCYELTSYANILDSLKTASSVREASDIVLFKFERPKDKSEEVQIKRASYGQSYYDKYANMEMTEPEEAIEIETFVEPLEDDVIVFSFESVSIVGNDQ